MKTTTNTIPGAGVILFRFRVRSEDCDSDPDPEFLLLKGRDTGVWSFPKGHPEAADNGEALLTATRETYEETGYLYDKDYHICGGSIRFGKRPYWVGYLSSARMPLLRSREHTRYAWLTKAELEVSGIQANLDVRGWLRRTSAAFQEAIHYWRSLQERSLPERSLPERSLPERSLPERSLPERSLPLVSSEMPETHSCEDDHIVTLT